MLLNSVYVCCNEKIYSFSTVCNILIIFLIVKEIPPEDFEKIPPSFCDIDMLPMLNCYDSSSVIDAA